jgi:cell pole-organizing protein PopZ
MEDILASIRRILNEDETNAPAGSDSPLAIPPAPPPKDAKDDVLVLDSSMMVGADPAPPPQPVPRQPAPQLPPPASPQPATQSASNLLVAPEAAASASAAVGALVQALVAERMTPVHRSGPTIEDVVRDELRPMLKAWLDQHLPPLVERLVRIEIERVVGRTL